VNTTTRRISATLTDPNSYGVSAVAFAPDGTTLAVGDNNGETDLWNTGTGKNTRTLVESQSTEIVTALAFTADGITLASGAGGQGVGTIYVWNTTTWTNTNAFNDPDFDSVGTHAMAFAPGGTILAIGDSLGTVHLWNTATGKTTAAFTTPDSSGASALAFAPDGGTLIIGNVKGSIYKWRISG
jgi:WD40 repeat protein